MMSDIARLFADLKQNLPFGMNYVVVENLERSVATELSRLQAVCHQQEQNLAELMENSRAPSPGCVSVPRELLERLTTPLSNAENRVLEQTDRLSAISELRALLRREV